VKWLDDSVRVTLRRIGEIPVPLDLAIIAADSSTQRIHIPIDLQFGHRPLESGERLAADWVWPHTTYSLVLAATELPVAVVVDPDRWWADVARENNAWPPADVEPKLRKKRKNK